MFSAQQDVRYPRDRTGTNVTQDLCLSLTSVTRDHYCLGLKWFPCLPVRRMISEPAHLLALPSSEEDRRQQKRDDGAHSTLASKTSSSDINGYARPNISKSFRILNGNEDMGQRNVQYYVTTDLQRTTHQHAQYEPLELIVDS